MKRRWLSWLVLLGLMLLVLLQFTSLSDLGGTLRRARLPWVMAAVVLHLAYFPAYTWLYKLGFALVDVRSTVRGLMPVFFASNVANAFAPTGGAAAAALFIDDASQRGESGARATVGIVLVLVNDLLTLVPFLAFSLVWLERARGLRSYDLVGAVGFVGFIGLLVAGLALAHRHATLVARVLRFVVRLVNRVGALFRRPSLLEAGWADRNASQLAEGARLTLLHRGEVGPFLAAGFFVHVLNLGVLWALFLAFDQPVTFGALTAGFTLGIVFHVISVIPQGIAIVEGVMALVFTSLGYPGDKVAAIVIAFRGLNYWLPLFIGLFYVHRSAASKEPAGAALPLQREPAREAEGS